MAAAPSASSNNGDFKTAACKQAATAATRHQQWQVCSLRAAIQQQHKQLQFASINSNNLQATTASTAIAIAPAIAATCKTCLLKLIQQLQIKLSANQF